jgi:hypothetical protein
MDKELSFSDKVTLDLFDEDIKNNPKSILKIPQSVFNRVNDIKKKAEIARLKQDALNKLGEDGEDTYLHDTRNSPLNSTEE